MNSGKQSGSLTAFHTVSRSASMTQWRSPRITALDGGRKRSSGDYGKSTLRGQAIHTRLEAGLHLLVHDLVIAVDFDRLQCLHDDLGRQGEVSKKVADIDAPRQGQR